METDVMAKSPEEACGLVAGKGNQANLVLPVTNILHEAFRFRMDPEEELKAFISVEEKGWDILAIYHSHPHGIDHPSQSDFDQLTFPDIIYLIWYQNMNEWRCRGYLMLADSDSCEVPVIILPD